MTEPESKGTPTTGGRFKNLAGFFTIFAVMANLKTVLSLSAGAVKFGWLIPTIGTMLVSLVLYACVYGWKMAFIVVPLILVHELGHWLWMKAYKLNPKAPIFVPFLGAFVAMTKMPGNEATHAWVAFAGPFVGSLGAVVCYWIGKYTGQSIFLGAAYIGFFINLVQLIPAKPLDGGFIVGAISRWLMIPGVIGLFVLANIWNSVFLDIIGIVAIFSLFKKPDLLGVTAGTVKDLETVFVESTKTQGTVLSGRASIIQRYAIGFAYLALVVSLGLMITWITIESGRAQKTFTDVQIKVLDRVIAMKDSAQCRFARAELYLNCDKIELAKLDLKRSIGLGKNDFAVYYALGRACLLNGQNDNESDRYLHKAIDLAVPNSDDEWYPAFGLLLLGRYDEVLKACENMPDQKDGLIAEVNERKGDFETARKQYEETAEKYGAPPHWSARWRRAMFNLSENKTYLAKIDLDKILQLAPKEPEALLIQGWYRFKKDDLDSAWQSSEETLKYANEYSAIEKQGVLSGCHRMRSEIAKKYSMQKSAVEEKQRWKKVAADELTLANKYPGFGDIFTLRNLN